MNPQEPLPGHVCCDNHGEGPSVYDLPIPKSLRDEWLRLASRRHFLGRMGRTLGWAGLAVLMGDKLLTGVAHAAEQALPGPEWLHLPNFPPAAKRCIYLFMSGAPPQMDMWDYKPGLSALYDKDLPDSVRKAASGGFISNGYGARLKERERQAAGTMSGGEQQMLAIGRALMARPRLLMLDEPSLGIAPQLVRAILDALVEINRAGVAVFLIEQNVHAALTLAHRAYILEGGRVAGEGGGAALLRDPHVRRAYLGPLAVGE